MNVRAASSFLPLISFAVIFTAARAIAASLSLELPGESVLLGTIFHQLLVACWVYLDRQARRIKWPFEFDAFIFFAWPVAVPYYLYKTRGARGLGPAVFIYTLAILPGFVADIIRLTYRLR